MDGKAAGLQRYEVGERLGAGGMGQVFQARDRQAGRQLAIKCLSPDATPAMATLFEREYRMLCQLAHPSVIEVYEYGLQGGDQGAPYYTMELLEGEDLSKQVPLAAGRASAIFHDIASSLALLHARGFVHRDVTARNIRVVGQERAKLLDFGAVAPFGPTNMQVGTPSYVAPEVVLCQPLDGRVDLYSLGVALYYALTGAYPYPARTFAQLRAAWRHSPEPPHHLVPDIPAALSALTMRLLALDRDARPRDAAAVMVQLATIGGLNRSNMVGASRAYLHAPALVGRSSAQRRVRERLVAALRGQGGGLAMGGAAGVGVSRMLDVGALEAKVLGAAVARVTGTNDQQPFGAAASLLAQLCAQEAQLVRGMRAQAPEDWALLFDHRDDGEVPTVQPAPHSVATRRRVADAFERTLVRLSDARGLVVTVEEPWRLDEASVAVLLRLLAQAHDHRALLLMAAPEPDVELQPGVQSLLQQCELLQLEPLQPADTRRLLVGLFGEVPHLAPIAGRLHALSGGLPREILRLAEHLVEDGTIRYQDGQWALPEHLAQDALPPSLADACSLRLARLSDLARELAECHVVSPLPSLRLEHYVQLAQGHGPAAAFAAVDELLLWRVVALRGDVYVLDHAGLTTVVENSLTPEQRSQRHLALSRLHRQQGDDPLLIANHLLQAGQAEEALSLLDRHCPGLTDPAHALVERTQLPPRALGQLMRRAFNATAGQQALASLRLRLARWLCTGGATIDVQYYFDGAPELERSLWIQTGLSHHRRLEGQQADPKARIAEALRLAHADHEALPEDQRLLSPIEALPIWARYVAGSVALGLHACDFARLRRLPGLVQPFSPLIPPLHTLFLNALAVVDTIAGDNARARQRYLEVLERLLGGEASQLEDGDGIVAGATFGLSVVECRMGLPNVAARLERVEAVPVMVASSLRLRAMLALQQGDWHSAQAFKLRAEQAVLESDVPSVFGEDHLPMELELCALALDLSAVRQLEVSLERLFRRHRGWRSVLLMARAERARLTGDLDASLAHAQQALEGCGPKAQGGGPNLPFEHAAACQLEVLCELGRVEEALTLGRAIVDGQAARELRYPRIQRSLALAEGRAGHHERAFWLLDGLIDSRERLAVSGIEMGLLHEAAAYCALWAGEHARYREHAERTAQACQALNGSCFRVRYQRLRDEARRYSIPPAGAPRDPGLPESDEPDGALDDMQTLVQTTLHDCPAPAQRAERALGLLARLARAESGFLFLTAREGVTCAATLPGSLEHPTLTAFVQDVVEAEQDMMDVTLTAAFTTDALDLDAARTTGWVDPQGRKHQALALWVSLGAESVIVGLAVLAGSMLTTTAPALGRCAAALGEHLVKMGDAMSTIATPHESAQG